MLGARASCLPVGGGGLPRALGSSTPVPLCLLTSDLRLQTPGGNEAAPLPALSLQDPPHSFPEAGYAVPVLLPSHDGGAFLELEAMALSHKPDLNLESTGQEPPPCLQGPTGHWALCRTPSQRYPMPRVVPSSLPFHQPGLGSFLPVRLPHRPEKGAAGPSPGRRHPDTPPKEQSLT